MKHPVLKILLLFVIFAAFSCQKLQDYSSQDNNISTENMVNEAKIWFANGPVLKEKELLKLSFNILPQKAPERVFARMGKLQNKLVWNDAKLFNRNGIQYIIVPLVQNKKLRSNDYEIARSFVFYKNNRGEMNMNVLEVMSEKGKNLNGKSGEVAATAFYNHMAKKSETVAGIDATVFFYNDAYRSLNSYEMKAGTWNKVEATLDIRNNTPGSTDNILVGVDAQICETYHVIHSIYVDGVLIYWEILYSYQECVGSGNGDPETEDPYGGGGGGGGGGQGSGDYDFNAEAALLSQVVSTNYDNLERSITFTDPTLAEVPFEWVVVKNSFNLWQVNSSDIAEGYNSANTGAILYRLQHLGSSISGQTSWNRIPTRPGVPVIPLINLSWDETSHLTTIAASDYRSGSVMVSGNLRNFGIYISSKTNSITIRVN